MANKVTKNLKKVRTFCQNEIKKNDKTINKNSMDAKWKSIFGVIWIKLYGKYEIEKV